MPEDFDVECVRCWHHRLGRCQGIFIVTPVTTLLDDTDNDEVVGGEARSHEHLATPTGLSYMFTCRLNVLFFVVESSQQVSHPVATSLVVVGRLARRRVLGVNAGRTRVGSAVDLHLIRGFRTACRSL